MNDNLCRHICEPEKLSPPHGPPPPQSSISQQKYHKTKCSKGTKGCRLKYKKTEATMDYSFLVLQFLLFNVSKGFLIQHSKGVMESQIRTISRHMEGQESSGWTHIMEKSKNICIYAHISMYTGLRSIIVCTREYGIKSCVQQ